MSSERSPTNHSRDSTSTSLLRRVALGDGEAWARFADLYSSLIYSRCRSRGVKPQDAADVVQDVFQRVHRKIDDFRRTDGPQSFRRWLRTITRNVITDHFRASASIPATFEESLLDEFADHLTEGAGETSDLSKDSVAASVLKNLMQSLRVDYEDRTWDAFWKTAVEGLSAIETAQMLEMTPGGVRQARYKILRRIRQEIEDVL